MPSKAERAARRRAASVARLRRSLGGGKRTSAEERRLLRERRKLHDFAERCADVAGLDSLGPMSREDTMWALEEAGAELVKRGSATKVQLEKLRAAHRVARESARILAIAEAGAQPKLPEVSHA